MHNKRLKSDIVRYILILPVMTDLLYTGYCVLLIMTFRDSTLNTADLCPAVSVVNFLLIYCDVRFCIMVHFRHVHSKHVHSELSNVMEGSVRCLISVLALVYSRLDCSRCQRSI